MSDALPKLGTKTPGYTQTLYGWNPLSRTYHHPTSNLRATSETGEGGCWPRAVRLFEP